LLAIEDLYGSHEVKLPAGDLVPPRPAFHMVALVTRRQRVGSFFWLQSMIDDRRSRRLASGSGATIWRQ